MRRFPLIPLFALAACTVEAGKSVPPVKGAGAVVVDGPTQTVSLDANRVPVVGACEPGELVARQSGGWGCVPSPAPGGITGILDIAHGGTGASTFAPGALPFVSSDGHAFTGLPPAPAGSVLGSDGTSWKPVTIANGSAARTTAALQLYVRLDGSDGACDGTADAASSAAPHCAFASPQRAIDAIPPVIEHPVNVTIAAGTYPASAAGPSIDIVKLASQAGALRIAGSGQVVLTGLAASDAPDPIGTDGLFVSGLRNLALENLTFRRFRNSGVVTIGGSVTITNVSVESVGKVGFLLLHGADATFAGTNAATACADTGLQAKFLATAVIGAGASLTVDRSGNGIDVEDNASLASTGNITVTNGDYYGLRALLGGHFDLQGTTRVSGNASDAILLSDTSRLSARGRLDVSTAEGTNALGVFHGSVASLEAGQALSFACPAGSTASTGFSVQFNSAVLVSGSQPVTVTNCAKGIFVSWSASVQDRGSGQRAITNTATAVTVDAQSSYKHGGFPSATQCVTQNFALCQ